MKFIFAAVFCSILLFAQGCQKVLKLESTDGMILIPGGEFQMGTNDGMKFESPIHPVKINSFWIDEHEITVAEFAEFVKKTGYKTEAEKFGWSAVFDVESGQWTKSDGANWRHPEGKTSTAKTDEPVSQISWNDASEYAKFEGKRLPTEAEFEYAARGGLIGKKYAWGDDLEPNGKPSANWWQGEFPKKNTVEDGFLMRSPIKSFAPNGYGLYDMTGNVWEWTNDFYSDDYYAKSPIETPKGAEIGEEKSIRGGSWMCAENFCSNYRVAGRSKATPDSAMNNLGFRCVKDYEK
jgi:formylglycine-generating enzyme